MSRKGKEEYNEPSEYRATRELLKHQRLNYKELLQTLGFDDDFAGILSSAVLNASAVGTGKTFVTLIQIAFINPKRFIVICPSTIKQTWKRTARWFYLSKRMTIYTYSQIIALGKNVRYTKADLTEQATKHTYRTTEHFDDLLDEGLVIVFDEASYIKNESSKRTASAMAMIKSMKKYNNKHQESKSKIIYLSATPTDKDEQKFVWLSLLGIMNANKPYVIYKARGRPQANPVGLESIKNWLKDNKPAIVDKLGDDQYYRLKSILNAAINNPVLFAEEACEAIYDGIVASTLMNSMPAVKDSRGCFTTLISKELQTPQEREIIEEAIHKRVILEEDKVTKKITAEEFFKKISPILQTIEIEKAHMMAREIDKLLRDDPHLKIVIQMNYIEALDSLIAGLNHLGWTKKRIAFIMGKIGNPGEKASMSLAEREENRLAFQEDNDRKRILIMSKVASMGIDADDISVAGRYRRIIFVMSSYFTIDIAQTFGRIHRVTTTSDALGYLVFYSYAEKMSVRLRQKKKTLADVSRNGSQAITDETPVLTYHASSDNCSVSVFNRKVNENNEVIRNEVGQIEYVEVQYPFMVRIGDFDTRLYELYLTKNPIDLKGSDTPKSGSFVQVTVKLPNRGKKNYKDVITIGTDMDIDTERLFTMDYPELRGIINEYYRLEGLDKKYTADKILQIEEINNDEVRQIDFFWPGFRSVDPVFRPFIGIKPRAKIVIIDSDEEK